MKSRDQHRRRSADQAQAIVEFAIVLPILMMLLVGILEVGRMIYIYAAVHNASREAVRYATAIGRDDNGKYKYNYCAGIEDRAEKSAYFVPLTIEIRYLFEDGTTDICVPDDGDGSDTGITVNSRDRVKVTVTTTYSTLVNLIPISPRPVSSWSARTILGLVEMEAMPSGSGGSGGSGSATSTPTPTPTGAGTPVTPVPTDTPTATPTPTNTPGGSVVFTPMPTNTPTATPTSTNTPDGGVWYTLTPLPTYTPTVTVLSTDTPTATATSTATATGTAPVCTATPLTLTASADAWINQSVPDTNPGSSTTLSVQSRNNNRNMRTFVQFSLPPAPAGCVIESAKLRLYASSFTSGRTLQAVQVAGSWTETGVTWTNQPLTAGPGVNIGSTSGWAEWTVTTIVQSMYSGTNYGFLIRDVTEGTNGSGELQQFHSRENTNKPELVITFGQAP